jgi:hypothetical protein
MFPIHTGETPDPRRREIHIEYAKMPFPLESNDGMIRYGFEIEIQVPAHSKFTGETKPAGFRVSCLYGFYGEGRSRRIIDHALLRFTNIRRNDGSWTKLSQKFSNKACFEDSIIDKDCVYRLQGETDVLDNVLASTTKHDLEIIIDRGLSEEVMS